MRELFEKCRTYRRFDASRPITDAELMRVLSVVDKLASAGNLQRIRYLAVSGERAKELFASVKLGGYLPEEKKPTADVAPTAYAVLLTERETVDTNLAIDIGIAAEAIALSAAEEGIGACIIRSFSRDAFSLSESEAYKPQLVIALGYPAESAKIVPVGEDGSLKYRIDENGVNLVPKLALRELILPIK